jgi:hypothetical protein
MYKLMLFSLGLLIFAGGAVRAEDNMNPLEPVDLSSPRATLESFLGLCEDAYLSVQGRSKACCGI